MDVSFQSDSDFLILEMHDCLVYGKPLSQRIYVIEPSKTRPHTTILFIHGICEHAFRYFPIAIEWAREGYQVLLFDLRGHGLDSMPIKPFLWLARAYSEVKDARKLTNAIESGILNCLELIEQIQESHLDLLKSVKMADHLHQISSIISELTSQRAGPNDPPFFLAGHSLGGLLTTEAGWGLGNHGTVLPKGIILFSPALKPNAKPAGGCLESAVLSLSWNSHQSGWLAPVKWMLRGFASLNLKQDTHWVSDWISDIPDERELHRIDPLILRKVPLSYLSSIERQMIRTLDKGARYPVDAIIFVPLADRIVDAEGTVAFGETLCTSRGDKSSQLFVYGDFWCHELLRSSRRELILDAVYRWLDMHCEQ